MTGFKEKTDICLRLGVKNEKCIEMWYQGAFAYFVKYDGTRGKIGSDDDGDECEIFQGKKGEKKKRSRKKGVKEGR